MSSRSPPVSSPDIEKLLYEFDHAWQRGPAPRIEDLLQGQTRDRRPVLEELVKIDLEYRWRRAASGNGGAAGALPARPCLEDYVARYAELGRLEALAPELIAAEYRVRQRWGDRPARSDYAARFPGKGPELQTHLSRIDAELAEEFGVRPKADLFKDAAYSPSKRASTEPAGQAIGPAADLLEALRHCQLLSPSQWNELGAGGKWADAKALAGNLLQRGWLTPYQVNQLLQGRGQDLVLGSYLLLERLGEGGAGQVFKARHQKMDRIVALKIIRKELLDDEEAVARFFREIEIVSRLDHPNVVHAYDAGPAGPTFFLAMELVEGTDLGRLVKNGGQLPAAQACAYIRQAALGLQHAHERGLVHRDIKPHNLMVSLKEGLVKVADLGLARLPRAMNDEATAILTGQRGTGTLTPEGAMLIGTADYLAPEQALDFHKADIRADIYSLGCTFYFLLTGQPPFPGGTLANKVASHLNKPPPDIEALRSDVPVEAAAALRKMLAKKPEARYQSPAEVASALDVAARGRGPLAALRRTLTGPVWGRLPRRRFLLIAGACALVPAAAYLALFRETRSAAAYRNLLAERNRLSATSPKIVWGDFMEFRKDYRGTPEAKDATELLRQDLLAYRLSHPGSAEAVEAGGMFMQLPSPLDQFDSESIPPERRLPRQPKELVAVFPGPSAPGGHVLVAVSPDGKLLATGGADNQVHLWDLPTAKERAPFKIQKGRANCLAFAPDSRTIAAAGTEGTLSLWDLGTGKEQTLDAPRDFSSVCFSPDGKLLAAVRADHQGKIWDLARLQERFTFKASAPCLAFSPDGKTLAVLDGENIKFIDLGSGKERIGSNRFSGDPKTIFAYAPDNRTMGVTWYGGQLLLWDTVSGKETRLESDGSSYRWLVTFTPDAKTFLYAPGNYTAWWDLVSSKKVKEWSWPIPDLSRLALAPDGRHLAISSTNGSIYILRLQPTAFTSP